MWLKGGCGCHRADKGLLVACGEKHFCTCGRRTQKVAAKWHVRLTAACDVLDSRQFPFVLGPLPSVCTICIPQWCIAIAVFSQAPNDADMHTYCLQCTSVSSELGCSCCVLTLTHQLRDHTNTFPTVCKNALRLCGPYHCWSRDCPTSAHVETARAYNTATRYLNEQRQYAARDHKHFSPVCS